MVIERMPAQRPMQRLYWRAVVGWQYNKDGTIGDSSPVEVSEATFTVASLSLRLTAIDAWRAQSQPEQDPKQTSNCPGLSKSKHLKIFTYISMPP